MSKIEQGICEDITTQSNPAVGVPTVAVHNIISAAMNLRAGETSGTGPECADPVMTGLMKVAARGRRWPTTTAAAAAAAATTLRRRGSKSRDHPPH